MKDFLNYLHLGREPKEFTGLKRYFTRHKALSWGSVESDNYEINVPPIDTRSGYLNPPDKPHVFIIDELTIGKRVFKNLVAVDTHGYIGDGNWSAVNGESRVDVVDLVQDISKHGHGVDILLMCAQYDFYGSQYINDPTPEYYALLNENNIVYSKPANKVVPVLKMDTDGRITGYLYDTEAFENLDRMELKK